MIRGILIDPQLRRITEVHIDEELDDIYNQIGVDTFDLIRVGRAEWLYVDDIGLYRDIQYGFEHKNYDVPIVNRALLLGDGEDCVSTLEEVKAQVTFLGKIPHG